MKFQGKVFATFVDTNEIVEVLVYDRDRYYTIRCYDGSLDSVKLYSLYDLPSNFRKVARHRLPYDWEEGLTHKQIAEDLRQHRRYHYKFLNNSRISLSLVFYNSSEFSYKTFEKEVKGNRQQLVKYLRSLPKDKVNNFSLKISFYDKGTSSFGSCLTYKDGDIEVSSFRNKSKDKYIKKLLRNLFEINVNVRNTRI